ncbi:MAG: sulfatase-like hydrolase/transferase, partial [Pedosphaera sp.]|nr:sulfatase-like hydrolase/transferase [Pedosphaera sp.]
MADDQGWGDMGYMGHKVLKTPVFDEMARTGLRFDRFYAAAPVCSPTRASVLTGRHPNRMGCFKWGHTLRPQEITVAEALKKAGYTTAHFGKWHLGSLRADSPVCPGKSGFDEWASAPNFYENSPLFSHNGKVIETKGESSAVTVDLALKWMAKVKDRPFLTVIWFGNPHGPHIGTDKFLKMYEGETKAMANFYAEITAMDAAMGDLRKGLRKLGVADNTVLWYCSDNGGLKPNSMGGLSGKKGKLLEGGIRVPAIIEWPAVIKKGSINHVPSNTVDIYPTVLELAGVRLPGNQPVLDGVSLADLIKGELFHRDKPMGFWDFPEKGRSRRARAMLEALRAEQKTGEQKPAPKEGLIDKKYPLDEFPGPSAWIAGDWKLHRIPAKNGKQVNYQLFNLAKDMAEKKDIAAVQPERLTCMRTELAAWQKSV